MHPSTKPTCDRSVLGKLGLFIWTVLLPLTLMACASTPSLITQTAPESQGDDLLVQAANPVSPPADNRDPLQVCAVVPEEDLQEMRGCLGVYYFDFIFDINLVANPEVSVKTNFTAVVPDGTSPSFNGTTAVFKDDNVFYMAGPTNGGLMSEVIVTGRDNFVFANTQFNIHMPNAALLGPTINVLPAASLTGIGAK